LQTSGEFTVAVPRDRAFAFISDPFRIAGCIPGCENLRELEPGTYAATLSNKVGPISVKFDVTVALTKVEPPEALDATVNGNAPALGGRLTATASLRLTAVDAATTHVTYAVEMGLSGRLGGIGQPVFRAKSDELSKKFGVNVRAAIEADAASGVSR
jgi:carbon monoxide dehydrogenase subunit G